MSTYRERITGLQWPVYYEDVETLRRIGFEDAKELAAEIAAEADAALAERDALIERLQKLARFGAWCAEEFRREMADVDGGSAQDAMERFGVLVKIEVTEPCGEGCSCAEVTDFPTDCYRFADDVKEALATYHQQRTAQEGAGK